VSREELKPDAAGPQRIPVEEAQMPRVKLTEAFHGEGNQAWEGVENLTLKGNEMMTVAVKSGTLQVLTKQGESDEEAIRAARFLTGDLELENGLTFSFWLSDEGRGGLQEIVVYPSSKPQTG
jgi:hypothetical protein